MPIDINGIEFELHNTYDLRKGNELTLIIHKCPHCEHEIITHEVTGISGCEACENDGELLSHEFKVKII